MNSESFSADEPISAINMTPFVDVALVLLIIFMVTAPVMLRDAISVDLPKASSSSSGVVEGKNLLIVVSRNGRVQIDGREVEALDLKSKLASSLKQDPNIQALVSADEDAKHGDVIRVLDQIKISGIEKFAIQIEKL